MEIFKRTLSGLIAALVLMTFQLAARAETPADAYARAVASYVDAATNEIEAIGTNGEAIKSTLPEGKRQTFKAFDAKLLECKQILTDLKAANASKFDQTKSRYEKARSELVAALERAQTPSRS